ncbi:hypothetical protein BDP27DRAFT_1313554 [Rhodocollybia butyracea]|uniref:Uncharacterized protein n=1 Tax=Rhodocollybia butyracea TaxID=206335 RepID=A0A9P5QA56_9AGAR|nr:hypothetical protein BDP27DRAFT_1313554 [Rhodocollybia butyracea]
MNVYSWFPDDNSNKKLCIQAAGLRYTGGERHVSLIWSNPSTLGTTVVTQIVQLGGQNGMYEYSSPVAKMCDERSLLNGVTNTFFDLGKYYTRVERDKILELATAVQFISASRLNGCRVWMRDLLSSMVSEGLLLQANFNLIVAAVPLPERQHESFLED